MKYKFRILIDAPMEGALNMGIDRAILQTVSERQSIPTLRLYSWAVPAVTVGYFQKISETVNIAFCTENNIPVIRRITGGGTVLHDSEITYSFITPLKNSPIPFDLESSFKAIIMPIIKALKAIGIDASFKPVNDILVQGKKISGSAQTRQQGVLLQHGTILTDIDENLFARALIDKKKSIEKDFAEPVKSITSVKEILGNRFNQNSVEILKESITNNYTESLNISFTQGFLSAQEKDLAERFRREQFENKSWNMKKV
ncbi:MAG: biotin/lipoate A/B protein ligase family protein [Spirochaetota bacterium]